MDCLFYGNEFWTEHRKFSMADSSDADGSNISVDKTAVHDFDHKPARK